MSAIDFIVGLTIAVILAVSCWIFPEYQCSTKAKAQGLEYDWGLIQGCMVREEGGKWIDYDRWRILE